MTTTLDKNKLTDHLTALANRHRAMGNEVDRPLGERTRDRTREDMIRAVVALIATGSFDTSPTPTSAPTPTIKDDTFTSRQLLKAHIITMRDTTKQQCDNDANTGDETLMLAARLTALDEVIRAFDLPRYKPSAATEPTPAPNTKPAQEERATTAEATTPSPLYEALRAAKATVGSPSGSRLAELPVTTLTRAYQEATRGIVNHQRSSVDLVVLQDKISKIIVTPDTLTAERWSATQVLANDMQNRHPNSVPTSTPAPTLRDALQANLYAPRAVKDNPQA